MFSLLVWCIIHHKLNIFQTQVIISIYGETLSEEHSSNNKRAFHTQIVAVLLTSISALGPFVANKNKMSICKLWLYIWYLGQIVHVYKQDLHLVPTKVRKLLSTGYKQYEWERMYPSGYKEEGRFSGSRDEFCRAAEFIHPLEYQIVHPNWGRTNWATKN